jgi:hypothetical protein
MKTNALRSSYQGVKGILREIASSFLIATVLVVLALLFGYYQFIASINWALIATIIAVLVFIVSTVITVPRAFRTRQLSTLKYQIYSSYRVMGNIKDMMFYDSFPLIAANFDFDLDERDMERFKYMCSIAVEEARSSLLNYFKSRGINWENNDVAVSVNLIISSQKLIDSLGGYLSEHQKSEIKRRSAWVITVYRDGRSYAAHRREVGTVVYDVSKNTVFSHLFEYSNSHFISNNLAALSSAYSDENTQWEKQYNAVLSVPIGHVGSNSGRSVIFGFLTADSMNKPGVQLFDGICVHILKQAADAIAIFLLSLTLSKYGQRNSQEEIDGQPQKRRVISDVALEPISVTSNMSTHLLEEIIAKGQKIQIPSQN